MPKAVDVIQLAGELELDSEEEEESESESEEEGEEFIQCSRTENLFCLPLS